MPQGAIAQMLRDNAARKVGTISHVGIGTFADPRNGGGRLSEKTKEDIVKIIELEGQNSYSSENSSGCGIHPRYICR